MKIELLDVRVTSKDTEVLFRVAGTEANAAGVADKTLGYDVLIFSPTATAKQIAAAVLTASKRVRASGIKRHQLWRDVEELL